MENYENCHQLTGVVIKREKVQETVDGIHETSTLCRYVP